VQASWRLIAGHRGISQSMARRHVARLADAGLVFVEAVFDREWGCQGNRFHLRPERRG
jgi:predicted ArsR family transcriptional regulator